MVGCDDSSVYGQRRVMLAIDTAETRAEPVALFVDGWCV